MSADQPRGSLLRRSPNPLATDVGELSSIEALDLPGPGVDGIRLSWASNELWLAFCGDEAQPGGSSVAAARSLVVQELDRGAIRGDGQQAVLTQDLARNHSQSVFWVRHPSRIGYPPMAPYHLNSQLNSQNHRHNVFRPTNPLKRGRECAILRHSWRRLCSAHRRAVRAWADVSSWTSLR